jgi:hypothetical protein
MRTRGRARESATAVHRVKSTGHADAGGAGAGAEGFALQNRVLPRRGVRDIDHRRRPFQRIRESLARNAVDACIGRCGYGFVPVLAELFDKPRSNEPGTANYYDFHDCPFFAS